MGVIHIQGTQTLTIIKMIDESRISNSVKTTTTIINRNNNLNSTIKLIIISNNNNNSHNNKCINKMLVDNISSNKISHIESDRTIGIVATRDTRMPIPTAA